MDNNYNFLGSISAIYDFSNNDVNMYITLTVFNNKSDLKIIYNFLKYLNVSKPSKIIKNGEIILKNIGEVEFDEITTNFSENLIKRLILAKFLDYFDDHLNFEIIY